MTELNNLEAAQIWEKLYGKELNCKKHILEYIAVVQKIGKEDLSESKWQEIYEYIYDSIEKLSTSIKPNTVVQLQNELSSALRKRVIIVASREVNEFIEFFKEAYPPGKRRKEFTWVLAEPSKITPEQILQTLKYISNWCKDNRLSENQKKDTLDMLKKLNESGNVKYINQVKSLVGIRQVRELSQYVQKMGPANEKRDAKKVFYQNKNKTTK